MNWRHRVSVAVAVIISTVLGIELLRRSAFGSPGRSPDSATNKAAITWLVPMQIDRPLLEQLAAEFTQQNPDIDLRLIFVPGAQYQPKLKTLIASGHPPDMFYCGDVWVAYLLPFLENLSPLFQRDAAEIDIDDIYPNVLKACRFNGEIRFAP